MNVLPIALRNTLRQKKRSLLLAGAIGFGMAVMTIVSGLTAGIMDAVKENVSNSMSGHLYVSAEETAPSGNVSAVVRSGETIEKALADSGIKYLFTTKRSSLNGSLVNGTKEASQSITGIDWDDEKDFLNSMDVTAGSLKDLSAPNALVLQEDTARRLRLEIGEEVTVHNTTVSGQNNLGEFRLIATVSESGTFGGASAYGNIAYVNELLDIGPGEFTSYNIYLSDIDDSAAAARKLYASLSEYEDVKTLQADTENSGGFGSIASGAPGGARGGMGAGRLGEFASMFEGIRGPTGLDYTVVKYSISSIDDMMGIVQNIVSALDYISLGVFGVLILIVMVGIANTFRMVLIERTREIGTIRAIGMRKSGVRNLFLSEAVFIALAGAAAGVLFALIIAGIVSLIPLSGGKAMVFFLSRGHIPFAFDLAPLLRNVGLLVLFSIAAAWVPAKQASRLKPAEALRAQY